MNALPKTWLNLPFPSISHCEQHWGKNHLKNYLQYCHHIPQTCVWGGRGRYRIGCGFWKLRRFLLIFVLISSSLHTLLSIIHQHTPIFSQLLQSDTTTTTNPSILANSIVFRNIRIKDTRIRICQKETFIKNWQTIYALLFAEMKCSIDLVIVFWMCHFPFFLNNKLHWKMAFWNFFCQVATQTNLSTHTDV